MKSYDVSSLGELLIDFTENGTSGQGNPLMEANAGGAPCNALAMLTRLGHKTVYFSKVGDDIWGRMLIERVSGVGIDASGIKIDPHANTTLAFVKTAPDGDREFSFYRNDSADTRLSCEDIDDEVIKGSSIVHFGTLSMTHETCRKATHKAIELAKESGALLSFDPNIRESLWTTMDEARIRTEYGLSHCDILKIADNEIEWFTGKKDPDEAIRALRAEYDIPLIVLSLGKNGSRAYMGDATAAADAFLSENTVETTGAGDTFGACVLHYVLKHGWRSYSDKELKEMLTFANAAASIITTRKGALAVMPYESEIEELMRTR